MSKNSQNITVSTEDNKFRATLADNTVTIEYRDGSDWVWAGSGKWDPETASIRDCGADLSDEAYSEIEAAIAMSKETIPDPPGDSASAEEILAKIDWNKNSSHEARISISDGAHTVYVSEEQLPERFSLREIAEAYTRGYDYNGSEETCVCKITDEDDGEIIKFVIGPGVFEWCTDRQYVSY